MLDTTHVCNEFKTLQQLKIWSGNHPDLALALGYTKLK